MRTGAIALLAMSLVGSSQAHRLDEYLQATLIGISRDAIDVEMQLVPGVAMLPAVLAVIDLDHDGQITATEERAYGDRVLRDIELRVDGVPAKLALVETTFPPLDAMREGLGTIRIKLRTKRSGHVLRFQNRHLPRISVYLVNCLAAPEDGLIVTRQTRDQAQRSIEVEYSFNFDRWAAVRIAIGILLAALIAVTIILKSSKPVS